MRNKKFFSIIMLTYNHEEYIEEAINSIFKQDFADKFELIISDDSSTDNTAKIVEQLIKNAPKHIEVKFFKQKENIGSLANFNFCLNHTNGKFIVVADGDDISKYNRLKKVYELYKLKRKDLYISNAEIKGGVYKYNEQFTLSKIDIKDIYSNKIPVFGASYVFNYELIEKYGLIDPIYTTYNNMDQNIFWRAWKEKGVYYIKEPLLYYRIHNNGMSLRRKIHNENNIFISKVYNIEYNLNKIGNLCYIIDIFYSPSKDSKKILQKIKSEIKEKKTDYEIILQITLCTSFFTFFIFHPFFTLSVASVSDATFLPFQLSHFTFNHLPRPLRD